MSFIGMPDPASNAGDPEQWPQANPRLGIRISVADERRAHDSRTFAVERLAIGDWPDPPGGTE